MQLFQTLSLIILHFSYRSNLYIHEETETYCNMSSNKLQLKLRLHYYLELSGYSFLEIDGKNNGKEKATFWKRKKLKNDINIYIWLNNICISTKYCLLDIRIAFTRNSMHFKELKLRHTYFILAQLSEFRLQNVSLSLEAKQKNKK